MPRRLPPHDLFAEQAILSGLLQFGEELMPQVAPTLQINDFYDKRHGLIYGAMLWLNEQGSPVDEITVTSRLRDTGHLDTCGGVDFVVSLSDLAIIPSNMESYAELVSRKAHMRNFILTASQAIDSVYQDMENPDQTLENAERAIFEVTQKRYSNEIISLEQATIDVVRMLEKRREQGASGVTTGFRRLDKITNGLQPSDLIIIAARPSMGKTAFALNIALNAAKAGNAVGVFSLEMSREQLVLRMLAGESKVAGEKLRSGFLSSQDYEQIIHAADSLSQVPVYIDDTPSISILELRAKARRLKMQHNLGMVIVDYLQLMRGRRDSFDSREQEISDISRSLKGLARELNIPVIALSQLNRKVEDRSKTDKRPGLSDLRESGAIEQDADVVAFIYRDIVYNPEADETLAEIIIGKQRNGPTGVVKLAFIKEFTSFENLAMEREPEEYY